MPRKLSHAARLSAGSEPTRSRIMFHAAMLRAPSGGGPIARETDALRAETYPLSRRFLAQSYPYSLREHIYRDRLVSCLEFPITAKTIQVFQRSS